MTTEEANDFFVFRDQISKQNVIRVKIKQKRINQNVYTYCSGNDCEVRISALLYLGGHPDSKPNVVQNFFLNEYRKQMGCHLFVLSSGIVSCAICYYTIKHIYTISEIHPISSVYPCFRNTGGPFIMGLLFSRSYTFDSGHRTFGRLLAGTQQGTGSVFDIEEDFLHNYKRYEQTGLYGLKVYDMNKPQTPFPEWKQEIVFAIYVCRGARLIVSDDRCYWSTPDMLAKTPESSRRMDRSLFQEGSLLIYEGFTYLTLGWETPMAKDGKETVGGFFTDFTKAIDLVRPTDQFLGSIMSGQNRFVIFLGYNESQYNSVCWHLMIKTKHSSQKEWMSKTDGYLLAPDGARIVDIQPWKQGFEQIYWRHKYQRLYRSVLSPEPSMGRLSFGIPPEHILKRILGLSNQEFYVSTPDNLFKPPQEYYTHSTEDNDIRKYLGPILEKIVDRDDWSQLNPLIIYPPPCPQLYPPIWDKQQNKLKYISYGTRPKFYTYVKYDGIPGIEYPSVKLDNELYVLKKRRVDEYLWEYNRKRPPSTNSGMLSIYDYRLGRDYLFYHRTNIKIGTLGTYYMDGPYQNLPENGVLPNPEEIENLAPTIPRFPSETNKHTAPQKHAPGKPVVPPIPEELSPNDPFSPVKPISPSGKPTSPGKPTSRGKKTDLEHKPHSPKDTSAGKKTNTKNKPHSPKHTSHGKPTSPGKKTDLDHKPHSPKDTSAGKKTNTKNKPHSPKHTSQGKPTSPGNPTSPEKPTSPGKQTSPEHKPHSPKHTGAGKKTKPEHKPHSPKQISPVKPTTPGDQTSPGEPTNPDEPTSPGEETSPEKPTSPGTQTSPEKPTSPGTQTSPEKPTSPGTQTSPDPKPHSPKHHKNKNTGNTNDKEKSGQNKQKKEAHHKPNHKNDKKKQNEKEDDH